MNKNKFNHNLKIYYRNNYAKYKIRKIQMIKYSKIYFNIKMKYIQTINC